MAAVPLSSWPTPGAAPGGRLRHLGSEAVEAAEGLDEHGRDCAGGVGFAAAVGRQIGPEQRVEHMPGDVEGEVLFEHRDSREVAGGTGRVDLLQGLVGAVHVGGMVLVVVQLHDAAADVGLERRVVVRRSGRAYSWSAIAVPL